MAKPVPRAYLIRFKPLVLHSRTQDLHLRQNSTEWALARQPENTLRRTGRFLQFNTLLLKTGLAPS